MMVNRTEIESKIVRLKLEHEKITIERKKQISDEKEAELFSRHKAILKEVADLEWQLKSSREKNEYRKSVLNLGKKWSGMRGAIESNIDTTTNSLTIKLCDVVLDLLDRPDLDDNFRDKLFELVSLIDSKRI
jgi:uncharacterized protein with von Willebrand factor type A (vWA) domain